MKRREIIKLGALALFSPIIATDYKGYTPPKKKQIKIDPSIKIPVPINAPYGTIIRVKGDLQVETKLYAALQSRKIVHHSNTILTTSPSSKAGDYVWMMGEVASNNGDGTCDIFYAPQFLCRRIP